MSKKEVWWTIVREILLVCLRATFLVFLWFSICFRQSKFDEMGLRLKNSKLNWKMLQCGISKVGGIGIHQTCFFHGPSIVWSAACCGPAHFGRWKKSLELRRALAGENWRLILGSWGSWTANGSSDCPLESLGLWFPSWTIAVRRMCPRHRHHRRWKSQLNVPPRSFHRSPTRPSWEAGAKGSWSSRWSRDLLDCQYCGWKKSCTSW